MVALMIIGRLLSLPLFVLKYLFAAGDRPRKLRIFLEDLGGIFVKFGELLAMRFDLLPLPYAVQLLNIRDGASEKTGARSSAELFEIFRVETGRSARETFESIESEPFAVSLFYQSYRAKLAANDVVVKIQKPRIRAEARADLFVLRFLASMFDDVGVFRRVSLTDAVRQLEEWLADELDLSIEAQNSASLYDHAAKHHKSAVRIPMIYSEFTKPRVLVREWVDGFSVAHVIARLASEPDDVRRTLAENDIDLAATSENLVRDLFRQYYVDGIFHLNPYLASLALLSGNRFSYADFGILGSAAYSTTPFLEFWKAALDREFYETARLLVDFAEPATRKPFTRLLNENDAARERFEKSLGLIKERLAVDITPILNAWHTAGSRSASAEALVSVIERARWYRITLPADAIAFLRALLMLDLIASTLSPSYRLADAVRRFITETPIAEPLTALAAAHHAEIAPVNEFESLHTVDIAPETLGETAMRAEETLSVERERFDAWIAVLVERVPDLYNEIKYV